MLVGKAEQLPNLLHLLLLHEWVYFSWYIFLHYLALKKKITLKALTFLFRKRLSLKPKAFPFPQHCQSMQFSPLALKNILNIICTIKTLKKNALQTSEFAPAVRETRCPFLSPPSVRAGENTDDFKQCPWLLWA